MGGLSCSKSKPPTTGKRPQIKTLGIVLIIEISPKALSHSEGKLNEREEHGEFRDSAKWAFCSEARKECDFGISD